MKILITGATGLIGSKLTKKCIDEGITVHYFTTRKEKIETGPAYSGFYWNPQNNEIDKEAFKGVSVIVNLVGATVSKRWTKGYKKVILDSRIQTANLIYKTLESIEHDVKHFISASGISIYPNSRTKQYTEESNEIDTAFLAEVVIAWEAVADRFKNLGIEVSKVRTGIVLAAGGGALPKIVKPVKMGLGAPLGSGNQWQSWIHVDDIAGIYYHILKNGLEGVYNAVAPNPVTNKELTRQIARRLNRPLWLPGIPGFVLKLILGEMAEIVVEGQWASSQKIEESRYVFKYSNIKAALEDLL